MTKINGFNSSAYQQLKNDISRLSFAFTTDTQELPPPKKPKENPAPKPTPAPEPEKTPPPQGKDETPPEQECKKCPPINAN